MRLRNWVIAFLLGLNLVLAATWYMAYLQEYKPTPYHSRHFDLASRLTKTNTVVRYSNVTWTEIESTNLATYITNLNAVGCPAGTIRDIILAEVNRFYARRRSGEIVTPDQQWWKADPDPIVERTAIAQLRELENERRATLTRLLGPRWETDTDVLAWLESNYGLTGPFLGSVAPGTKRDLYDLATETRDEAKTQNPMEAARLRQEQRARLVTLLMPDAFTEYTLRYSESARELREETRGLNLSPEQFKRVFATVDPILIQPPYYYKGTEPDLLEAQRALAAQYAATLKQMLGNDLYAVFQLNQDPLYLSSKAAAEQAGIPAQSVMQLYEINSTTQAELNRIRGASTLTDTEKIEALATTRAEAQKSVEQLVGPEAFQRWLETQP